MWLLGAASGWGFAFWLQFVACEAYPPAKLDGENPLKGVVDACGCRSEGLAGSDRLCGKYLVTMTMQWFV